AHGHQASDHVMIWKSFAGFEPTAALPGCRSTRVPKSARTAATARSTAARHPAVRELGLLSGPEGTRTPGLLAASQSLSQLSYGPRDAPSLAPRKTGTLPIKRFGRSRDASASSPQVCRAPSSRHESATEAFQPLYGE